MVTCEDGIKNCGAYESAEVIWSSLHSRDNNLFELFNAENACLKFVFSAFSVLYCCKLSICELLTVGRTKQDI